MLRDDPVQAPLDALARETLAAAPRGASVTLVRLLAERRRAATASRRLLIMVAGTWAVPLLVVLIALILHQVPAHGAAVLTVLLAASLAPIIETLAPDAEVDAKPALSVEDP